MWCLCVHGRDIFKVCSLPSITTSEKKESTVSICDWWLELNLDFTWVSLMSSKTVDTTQGKLILQTLARKSCIICLLLFLWEKNAFYCMIVFY